MSISQTLLNNPTYNIINNITFSPPFKLLYDHICAEACAESGLYDDMKCQEGTRKLILERLENWVAAPGNADRLITWLDGPMGSGKTSVAVTVAERASAKNQLIGSFVFRRGQPGRNEDTRFVATLAYQMALSIPLVRPFIEEQISYDHSILKQSLSRQLNALILKPLRKMRSQHPEIDVATLPHLIIIDGLDECGPDNKDGEGDRKKEERGKVEQQLGVLELLHRLVLAQDILPFAVLVHSRPEIHIHHWFGIDQHAGITNHFTLDSSYKPDDDIRLFVTHGLLSLLETHPFCVHLRGTNWPYEVSITYIWGQKEVVNAIELIVNRSEGLFIFAAIVMRFISSKCHRPSERLLQILGNDRTQATAYTTPMDALYTHILDSISNHQVARRILTLNSSLEAFEWPETDVLHVLLSVLSISKHDLDYFLQESAAILTHGIDPFPFLMFHHSSLGEYLGSRKRSQHWCIDNYQWEIMHELLSNAFKLFSSVPPITSVKEQLFYLIIAMCMLGSSAAWTKDREDWGTSSVVKEFKGFCNFQNSSYHTAVMRVLTSDLSAFLDITFSIFNELTHIWVERSYKKWVHKFSSHIRTLFKPHVKPYLKNPRTFAIFLCRIFDIPASNTDYMEDIPSPPSCPFGLATLLGSYVSSSVRPEWLLYVLSIPNRDFLCEAITILLKHAGRPSVMFCLRSIAKIINIFYDGFDLSQELWLVILDCDEYFTPYLRGRLHNQLFGHNLQNHPLAFRRLHYQHQYCRNPILPFNIALGICYWEPPNNNHNRRSDSFWFLREYYIYRNTNQIVIPSVPPLARYMVYCRSARGSIPVPKDDLRCECSRRICFDALPDWMRL